MEELKTVTSTENVMKESIMAGDKPVMNLVATIQADQPENMVYSPVILNQKLYFENIKQVREKQAAFEDRVYEQQQKMIAEGGNLS